jgi:hypothetical protein
MYCWPDSNVGVYLLLTNSSPQGITICLRKRPGPRPVNRWLEDGGWSVVSPLHTVGCWQFIFLPTTLYVGGQSVGEGLLTNIFTHCRLWTNDISLHTVGCGQFIFLPTTLYVGGQSVGEGLLTNIFIGNKHTWERVCEPWVAFEQFVSLPTSLDDGRTKKKSLKISVPI